jgi:BlaI family penicillinase repressor
MVGKASESEMTVLAALLHTGESTAADLHAAFSESHGWAHSTVVTFLRRLEAKGLVRHNRRRGQRAFVYRPTKKAGASRHRVIRDVLERLFGGNPLPLVSSLLEHGNLSQKQVRELQRMIEHHIQEKE